LDQAFANLSVAPPPAPAPEAEQPVERPVVVDEPVRPLDDAVVAPAAHATAPSSATLASAFAALLAAERSGHGAASADAVPAAPLKWSATDAMIERVSQRVLEHLSDAVVRETVAEIVQAVAERLVREEIERIKSNIK
jgi:hypothetical protein